MDKKQPGLAIAIVFLIAFIVLEVINWAFVCGIYYIICYLFKWEFCWTIGTGLWLFVNLLDVMIIKRK